jgi:hypothetical protein
VRFRSSWPHPATGRALERVNHAAVRPPGAGRVPGAAERAEAQIFSAVNTNEEGGLTAI